jgi:hypothetical protein
VELVFIAIGVGSLIHELVIDRDGSGKKERDRDGSGKKERDSADDKNSNND